MGEIFARTEPATALPWTGERLTTKAGRQVEIEHLHRYLFARTLCRGLNVLDIASGEGYGTAFLAQTARSVVGIELDINAVKHARSSYVASNLHFLAGDARCLPLQDACVDVVVSFETIEHFYEHDVFLAEICRVLRLDGCLVVSSPERDVYSPAGLPPNPYHVRELTRAEFSALLCERFKFVTILGQRSIVGSALVTEQLILKSTWSPTLTFERRGPDWFEASDGLPRPVYLLAIASNAPIQAIPDSLYIDGDKFEQEQTELATTQDNKQQATLLAEAGQYARHVEAQLAKRDRDSVELRNMLGVLEAQNSALTAQLDEVQLYTYHLEVELENCKLDLGNSNRTSDM